MTPDTLIKQGLGELDKGNLRSALPIFEQAKRLSSQEYRALLYSGFTFLMLGRFNEALLDFQSALPLSPKDPEIHDFLGRCWMSPRR